MCLVGVVVRRYIDFLILLIPTPLVSAHLSLLLLYLLTYPYSSCICSFVQQHPYFCSFFNVFRSLLLLVTKYNTSGSTSDYSKIMSQLESVNHVKHGITCRQYVAW